MSLLSDEWNFPLTLTGFVLYRREDSFWINRSMSWLGATMLALFGSMWTEMYA
jgi:hypothetical protein